MVGKLEHDGLWDNLRDVKSKSQRAKMKRNLSRLPAGAIISAVLLTLVGFFCPRSFCLAAGADLANGEHQTRAVVINVDKWAVYVPNQVFYFDTNTMKKSEIEALKAQAGRLRNQKALITYRSTPDPLKDNRAMLVAISAAPQTPNPDKVAQGSGQPDEGGPQAASNLSAPDSKTPPTAAASPPSPITHAQVVALVEALRLAAPRTGISNDGLYSDWKIKESNILRWSRKYAGKEIAPQEFEANPEEARELLICVMGKILREQYAVCKDESMAVRRAASWWMSGDPGQFDTPPTSSYTMKVLSLYMSKR
jgi:hypothetical protein